MSISTRTSYVILGTEIDQNGNIYNTIELPAPVNLSFSDEFVADAERNADVSAMVQMKGRTQYTTSLKWLKLKNTKFWELNRFFENCGYVFYMKYFSHTDGKVKVQQFYRGNMEKATPSAHTEVIQGETVPTYYLNVGYNVIDMGRFDTVTIKSMVV